MTEITTSEIKLITIQIILMAILGTFMFLFSESSISSAQVPGSTINQSTTASASDQSWISGLISIPDGMGTLTFISFLVISPFLVLDGMLALRFAKDIVTKWV